MAEIPVIGKPMVGIAGGMQDGIMALLSLCCYRC